MARQEHRRRSRRFTTMSTRSVKDWVWLAAGTVLAAAAILQIRPRNNAPEHPFNQATSLDEPMEIHLKRAAEKGRGRHARHFWQIPWRGWKDILWRTYWQ